MDIEHKGTPFASAALIKERHVQLQALLHEGLEALYGDADNLSDPYVTEYTQKVTALTGDLGKVAAGLESADSFFIIEPELRLKASCEGLAEVTKRFLAPIKAILGGTKQAQVDKQLKELSKKIQDEYGNEEWLKERKWHSPFRDIDTKGLTALAINGELDKDKVFHTALSDANVLLSQAKRFAQQLDKAVREMVTVQGWIRQQKEFTPEIIAAGRKKIDAIKVPTIPTPKVTEPGSVPEACKSLSKKEVLDVADTMSKLLTAYQSFYDAFDARTLLELEDAADLYMEVKDKEGNKAEIKALCQATDWSKLKPAADHLDKYADVVMQWLRAMDTWVTRSHS